MRGQLTSDRVAVEPQGASALRVPTRGEPFGLIFVEALTVGVPVVATTIGAFPDIVQHGETGYLVPPGDVRALVEALDALVGDPAVRALGSGSKASHERAGTWPRVADAIADEIRQVLGPR